MDQDGKKYYMYVLLCADGTLYTGYTTDLARREKEHNSGKGARYTHLLSRRPCRMLVSISYPTRSQAMSAEYRFKQYDRQTKIERLKSWGVDDFTMRPGIRRIDKDCRFLEEGK